jgi:transmembrane 9 superfamily member 3
MWDISYVDLGIVGESDKGDINNVYIWTHKKFDIGYNDENIVEVNLTSEVKVKVEPNAKLAFTYEVRVFTG